jgi:serine/threonine-protein kinase
MSSIRLSDRYVLCGQIGAGGMASVHIGRLVGSVAFARTVAIKRLLPHYVREPAFRLMLTDEARLAARVRHPHVVQTLEVVSAGDELFLVMEYIDGVSLGRLMHLAPDRVSRVPEPILAAVIGHVLDGLHAAHEACDERGQPLNIVHRDISPDNVLVGADGFARVLDFGIAKARSRLHQTRDGELKGKLSYMAPEQLSGKVSSQSDVFAAAIIAWEGLVGRRLFQADDDGETIGRVLATQIEPPASAAPGVSPALSAIVMRGLARDPAQRWATARDMAQAIEHEVAVATPSQIAAWVEAEEGVWLAERRALVRKVESMVQIEPAVVGERNGLDTAVMSDSRTVMVRPAVVASTTTPPKVTMPRRPTLPASAQTAGSTARGRVARIAAIAAVLVASVAVAARIGAGTATSGVASGAPQAPATAAAAGSATSGVASGAPQAPEPPAAAGSAVGPSGVASRAPQAPGTPAASSGDDAAPTAAPAAPPRRPAHPTAAAHAAPAKKAHACDPPYRLGPLGEKVWLKECL